MTLQYQFCEEVYQQISKTNPSEENLAVCSLLIEDAKILNVDIDIVLSIAWEESRMTSQPKPNPWNCVGPLQIKVEYWCPKKKLKNCDTFYHGVKTINYYIKKFKPFNKAICFYNDATKKACKQKTDYKSRYVLGVLKNLKRIKTIMAKEKYKSL